ncbi:hypothetical protein OEZ85_000378 [Tetradesmus obliquus]|uniref:Uncharacterized protein n=1 Tax=Tetradesmus obliquus TaxID=3088 RepID=A0ABY8UR23_TETOB|nr:hypothetical protein OEZ85_000378 [Tetradesmus obliquus]
MNRSNAFLAVAVLACLFVAPQDSLTGNALGALTGGLVNAEIARDGGLLEAAVALGDADAGASIGTDPNGVTGVGVDAGVGNAGVGALAGLEADGQPTLRVSPLDAGERTAGRLFGTTDGGN